MSRCIAGREVRLRFRNKKTSVLRCENVVCPATWGKSRLLDYCRREHPGDTVTVEEWGTVSEEDHWRVRLWIVAPDEILSGRR